MKVSKFVTVGIAAIAAMAGAAAQKSQTGKAPDMDMSSCNRMMAESQKVNAISDAQMGRLRHLLITMKNARHDKVSAIESVVNELAQEQLTMIHTVNVFHYQMMTHMVDHMQNHTLDLCPMMKQMSAGSKKAAPRKGK